jgi:hypothetical protein
MSTVEPALPPTYRELRRIADLTIPLALRAVAELQIADRFTAGPCSAAELAAEAGCDAGALERVLRMLAGVGVFAEIEPGLFTLTPVAELLRGDHPLSLRDAYPLIACDLLAWGALGYSLRTGRAAFEHVHGRGCYEHLAVDSAFAARFDRSVEAQNRIMLRALLAAYDWSGCGTIVDVAGGTGTMLAGLLARHRGLRGVLVDLPHVLAAAPARLRQAGVADRCRLAAGSYFDPLPPGGDTYVLKTVLKDWDDERARLILARVADAVSAGGRALVLEALLPAGDEFHIGKLLDLNSLVLVGGPDRDERDLVELLGAAGLRIVRIVHTTTLAIFEAVPVQRRDRGQDSAEQASSAPSAW